MHHKSIALTQPMTETMAAEPKKLADIIREMMAILTRRREVEQRIKEGRASAGDRAELKALNRRLQEWI